MENKNFMMLFCFLIAAQSSAASDADTKVKLEGIKSDKGSVIVYLYESEDGFPTDLSKGKKINQSIKASTEPIFFSVENLVEGKEYALAVFHDENDNGKFDTNFLGIPKEGVATSNNAKGRFGPPKFNDAKFKFVPGIKLQPIRMRYVGL